MSRNWDDPKYKAARAAARKRDGYRCLMCQAKNGLISHHVRRWCDAPVLRTATSNLATLCRGCHKKVTGREDSYAPLLLALIAKRLKGN